MLLEDDVQDFNYTQSRSRLLMQVCYFSSLALNVDNETLTYAACKQLTRKKVRSSSVYRMASSFELGDEQNFRKNDLKENGRDFGNFLSTPQ